MAILCTAALILSACHTHTKPLPNDASSDIVVVDTVKYSNVYGTYMQYRYLTDAEKKAYGIVFTAVYDHLDTDVVVRDDRGNNLPGIRISLSDSRLTVPQISRVFEAFLQDNPSFFFIDRTYSLEGREINGKQIYDILVLHYTMDAPRRSEAGKQLDTALETMLKGCPDTDDEFLIELYLHDQLLASCAYDQPAADNPDGYPNAYSAYGALVEGKAVCEGYAKAMQLLLAQCSVSATTVRGYSADNHTGHMWNLVQINGQYYYLDPTWNDDEKQHHYSYFNISSAWLKRSHILDSNTLFTITCTAETDNFFSRNKSFIDTYDRDAIVDAIASQIQAGSTSVHLRFSDGKYENGLLFLKNAKLTKKMVNARLTNDMQMWDYELSTPAHQNTITLRKI